MSEWFTLGFYVGVDGGVALDGAMLGQLFSLHVSEKCARILHKYLGAGQMKDTRHLDSTPYKRISDQLSTRISRYCSN
jgi:hypothetical protein